MSAQRAGRRRIRVLQISHDLKIGGLQRVVSDLARGLNRERFESTVCTLRGGGALEKELREAGVPVYVSDATDKLHKYTGFYPLYRAMKERKPDVVHTHNTMALQDGIVASLLAAVPVRIHTDHAREFPDKRRYMLFERVASYGLDRFVAVSEDTRQRLMRYERISPWKMEVIHNGIDDSKLRGQVDVGAVRREVGLEAGDFPVLGIGVRLCRQKGIGYLLEAVGLLVREFPSLRLLICGEGELEPELRKQAVDLGLQRHVRFLGPRMDMHVVLRVLDLYVLPSVWEGLPLVLIEAMAASLPIIATNVGGNAEIVEDGANGTLIPAENPERIREAVSALARDPGKRRRMGLQSRVRFEEHFRVSRMIADYESLYGRHLRGKGRGEYAWTAAEGSDGHAGVTR